MNKFEADLKSALGEQMKQDNELCRDVWSALANVGWYHPESHEEYSCSFRYAGALIADIIGRGNYLDWYCSSPYAQVSEYIGRVMKKHGWIADTLGPICDEPGCYEFSCCGMPTKDGYRHTCNQHIPKESSLYRIKDQFK